MYRLAILFHHVDNIVLFGADCSIDLTATFRKHVQLLTLFHNGKIHSIYQCEVDEERHNHNWNTNKFANVWLVLCDHYCSNFHLNCCDHQSIQSIFDKCYPQLKLKNGFSCIDHSRIVQCF
ncbi:hypothetical protein BLOT_011385 [Blomia tropicalis]|nr:hypothetical protein BLOT_011385 [Blomia tropicalis]